MAGAGRGARVAFNIIFAVAIGAAGAFALRSPLLLGWFYEQQARIRLAQQGGSDLFDDKAMRVVLCGTSSPVPDASRAKTCTIVIAGDRAFVVDTGPESWKTLALGNFPGERIAGIMLTHFHSDHIGDLGEFRMQSWVAGRKQPLPVYGGAGVERIVAGVNETFAQDDVYRSAHHGAEMLPLDAAPLVARPFEVGSSDMRDKAQTILEENGLKVTAFEVDHQPVKPAVGYRFDYRGRSVVISGDTRKSRNVAKWSHGVDLLVHEAENQRMRDIVARSARTAGNQRVAKVFDDIENYHTSPRDAAEIANEAGARMLVYTHFLPPLVSWVFDPLFFDGVDEIRAPSTWVAGADGMRFDLPFGSDAIERSQMSISAVRLPN